MNFLNDLNGNLEYVLYDSTAVVPPETVFGGLGLAGA